MKQLLIMGIVTGFLISLGCDQPGPDSNPVTKKAPAIPADNAQGGPTIGEMAPEIVGADLEGVEFKLSDYRGQVIMLDFYGDW